jgi:prepilin-type N-terminal cleavage/methylation domain-containing protein
MRDEESPAVCESEREMIMTVKQRKTTAAFTLTEVMAAILIVTIVIAGGSFLFVTGRSQISQQKHYRVATQLAAQRLEELKDVNYPSIVAGDTEEAPIDLEDETYTRSTHTVVNANPAYKEVTVTVSWLQGNNPRDVSLVTCIAP